MGDVGSSRRRLGASIQVLQYFREAEETNHGDNIIEPAEQVGVLEGEAGVSQRRVDTNRGEEDTQKKRHAAFQRRRAGRKDTRRKAEHGDPEVFERRKLGRPPRNASST